VRAGLPWPRASGRLRVEWNEAKNAWPNPEIPHYKWRIRGPRDKGEIVEYAEPAELWRSWLDEVQREIDALAGAL
jgi:hypothetical protein